MVVGGGESVKVKMDSAPWRKRQDFEDDYCKVRVKNRTQSERVKQNGLNLSGSNSISTFPNCLQTNFFDIFFSCFHFLG